MFIRISTRPFFLFSDTKNLLFSRTTIRRPRTDIHAVQSFFYEKKSENSCKGNSITSVFCLDLNNRRATIPTFDQTTNLKQIVHYLSLIFSAH